MSLILSVAGALHRKRGGVTPPVGGGTPTLVQSALAEIGNTSSGTVTLGNKPTKNNLLLMFVQSLAQTPTIDSGLQLLVGISGTVGLHVYAKISDGTEQTVSVASSIVTGHLEAALMEYTPCVIDVPTAALSNLWSANTQSIQMPAAPAGAAVAVIAVSGANAVLPLTAVIPDGWNGYFFTGANAANGAYPIVVMAKATTTTPPAVAFNANTGNWKRHATLWLKGA